MDQVGVMTAAEAARQKGESGQILFNPRVPHPHRTTTSADNRSFRGRVGGIGGFKFGDGRGKACRVGLKGLGIVCSVVSKQTI